MSFYDSTINFIARAIAIVAPNAAANYLHKHEIVRMYEAAKSNGANRFFRPPQTTGAQEIKQSWQAVTNKIRALDRDNSHVAGMRRRFNAALIGEGSWPRPKILKQNAKNKYDFDVKLNFEILNRWEEWADEACANGKNIYQLQRIAANHFFLDGGCLIRRIYRDKKLKLEILELDQLDKTQDYDNGTGIRVVEGIKIDEFGKPISYFIKRRHPAEVNSETVEIPASEIIHLYEQERASAVSGISRMAPSVMNFHNIGMYRTDTMKLARVATGFGVFVETNYPEDYFQDSQTDENGNEFDYVTPGAIHYLRPGEKISTVSPQNPGSQYAPFLKAELQSASVGAGMSYEAVSNDGANTNFSGARQMLLFERAMIRQTFAIFEDELYKKIYEWFLEYEVSFNGLQIRDFDERKSHYLRATWSRPRTEWVDPLKDANAAKTEIEMGANTITDFCETAGRDIEEIVATRKYESDLFKNAGLNVPLEQQNENDIVQNNLTDKENGEKQNADDNTLQS